MLEADLSLSFFCIAVKINADLIFGWLKRQRIVNIQKIWKLNLDVGEEEDKAVAQTLEEKFEDIEVDIHQGDQPVYPYLFSVE